MHLLLADRNVVLKAYLEAHDLVAHARKQAARERKKLKIPHVEVEESEAVDDAAVAGADEAERQPARPRRANKKPQRYGAAGQTSVVLGLH